MNETTYEVYETSRESLFNFISFEGSTSNFNEAVMWAYDLSLFFVGCKFVVYNPKLDAILQISFVDSKFDNLEEEEEDDV